jgi:hypothetical protein
MKKNETNTMAQNPNTTSTSPSKCHIPAWLGCLRAKPSKNFVEKVWITASPKRRLLTIFTVVGFMVIA